MIRAALFDSSGEVLTGGLELVDAWRDSSRYRLWLDIEGESREVEKPLLESFGLHPLAIQDALRTRHPPKVETFDSFLFILLRGLDAASTDISFGVIQLSLFVGDRFLLTRHDKPSVSANLLYESILRSPEGMNQSCGSLALSLANYLQRRYVEILLELEPRLEAVEEEVFERPDDSQLAELTGYKSNLRQLSRIANYHSRVVGELQRHPTKFIPADLEHEITDLYEQTERSHSLAELYYHMAVDLTDGYLALSSHRLNGVMRILTIITVLFVPLTFIAGIYGMNFDNMPELHSRVGYFVVISAMAVIAVFQLFIFRRKGWL